MYVERKITSLLVIPSGVMTIKIIIIIVDENVNEIFNRRMFLVITLVITYMYLFSFIIYQYFE